MKDIIILTILVLVGCSIFAILYVLPSFSYEIGKDFLRMKMKIFRYVPFDFWKIRIDDIQEARRSEAKLDLLKEGVIFGNLFARRGIILILKKSALRFLYRRKVWITPENPEEFLAEIESRVKMANSQD